jgi:hypothetical protein
MRESDLQKAIAKRLNSYCGCFFVRIHGGPYQRIGLPDVVGLYRGTFFGLEIKMPGKERNLTDIQRATLKHINDAGGVGEMITSVEQAEEVVFNGKRPHRRTRRKVSDR